MANTYTQLHVHAVFAVQNRSCIIQDSWKDELYQYLSGIIRNNHHRLLAINGMPDHIHLLFGMRPSQSLSDLMQDIKGDSSKWINQKKFLRSRFAWQEGYGAFSCSKSQLPQLIQYIAKQEEHHKRKDFVAEYQGLLKEFGIDYDAQFIFRPV